MPDWRGGYRARVVLVIGAAGFLGRNLARALADCGARLTLSATTEHSFPLLLPPSARIRHAVCDVRDPAALPRLVQGQDVVFNLAGRAGSVASTHDPAADAQVNLL